MDASAFDIAILMQETRKIAKMYRVSTGKPLPVANELAKYDCKKIFLLQLPNKPQNAIDFIGSVKSKWPNKRIQVKSSVITSNPKNNQRIGQLSLTNSWDLLLLVIYDTNYEPQQVFSASYNDILVELQNNNESDNLKKKGAMTLAKFRKIAECVWLKS